MSHVTDVKLKIKDLEALEEAAAACGLDLRLGQTTHAWYGKFMNDSEEGRRVVKERGQQALGKCEHALRLKNHQQGDYEIGVVKSLDGDGYDLLLDEWGPGRKLVNAVGPSANKLRQEYAVAQATRKAKATLGKKGFTVAREDLLNGSVRLKLRRR